MQQESNGKPVGTQWASKAAQWKPGATAYHCISAHACGAFALNNYRVPLHLNATPSQVGLEVHNSVGQLVVCNWAVKYGMTGV